MYVATLFVELSSLSLSAVLHMGIRHMRVPSGILLTNQANRGLVVRGSRGLAPWCVWHSFCFVCHVDLCSAFPLPKAGCPRLFSLAPPAGSAVPWCCGVFPNARLPIHFCPCCALHYPAPQPSNSLLSTSRSRARRSACWICNVEGVAVRAKEERFSAALAPLVP